MITNLTGEFPWQKPRLPKCVPKALDVFVCIVDIVLAFRFAERTPTLSEMARVVSTRVRLLRFSNLDERIETENQAVLALARKRQNSRAICVPWHTNFFIAEQRELRGSAGLFFHGARDGNLQWEISLPTNLRPA